MKNYLAGFLMTFLFISCKKEVKINKNVINNNQFQFIEIGSKEILTTKFPAQWNVRPYDESPPISQEDIELGKKLNELDYFDLIHGKQIKAIKYNSLLKESNQIIDSIFVIDSISNKNTNFVYLKSFKTLTDNSYDFPPKIREIDLLIFSKSGFKKKINLYSDKNYPFFVQLKLGFLDKQGNLYTKEFETDEENTKFTIENHYQIAENGDTKLIRSKKQKTTN